MTLPISPRIGHLWSPDGTLVAVGRSVDGDNGLVIIDATSGEELFEVPAPDQTFPTGVHYPSWQRLAIER